MEVKLDEKDAADWTYRGEGACNIVLAYSGSSPIFIGKVMRIQKVARNGKSGGVQRNLELSEKEKLLWRDAEEVVSSPNREIADQLYVKHVMTPLLGAKYVDSGMRVLVTRNFLEAVEKNVMSWRPAWRVDASKVDLKRDSVVIMSDHSVFPHGVLKGGACISVEIKPKCGFLPVSKFIAEGNSVKRSTTRFRMHQALKLQQQVISELSKYNPLDLFSASKERILKAIKDLYTTPQNNFRVFLNGSLVLGGLGGGAKKTDAATEEAFEDVLEGIIRSEKDLRTSSFIELVAETVYSSGVLNQLLEVQKLDTLDIEGAIHAYYNLVCQPCVVCKEFDAARVTHEYAFLHSIPMDESLKILKNFLIAATAKDCSLMITFRPREDDLGSVQSSVYLQSTDQNFDYKVNFIDLDLKPLRKMVDYYELDKRVLSYYTSAVKMEHGKGNTPSMEIYEVRR
ncbi:hypothetical protein K2173_027694 [Erythroxylum novogranatense]|uniref:Inositol-pentakisphosphate 2-kinase n=1 Tax=Erythroxylum novogranatense TaxID=1862640 RepID=A0AAV8TZW7_9ROSI|nr:hypothetical protein K2173_027694 [Erythroxylum novogranatense]